MAYRYGNQAGGIEQSHYDAGYLKILELQYCWQNFRRYYRSGNFEKANAELDIIWMEFEVDSTDEQKEEIDKIDINIEKSYTEKEPAKRYEQLFKHLRKKRLLVGQVEKSQGMGKRYYDEGAEDLI